MSIPSNCLACGGSGPTPVPCPHDKMLNPYADLTFTKGAKMYGPTYETRYKKYLIDNGMALYLCCSTRQEMLRAFTEGLQCGRILEVPEEKKSMTPKDSNIRSIIEEVLGEVLRATSIHKPMNSPHEAHSVIEEEFDEFWDEVKQYNLPKGRDTRPRMREELVQLAAMVVRAISDVIDRPGTAEV